MHRGVFFLLVVFFISGCATGGFNGSGETGAQSRPPKTPFVSQHMPGSTVPPSPVRPIEPAPAVPGAVPDPVPSPIPGALPGPIPGMSAQEASVTPRIPPPSKPAHLEAGLIVPPGQPDIKTARLDGPREKVVIDFDKADITEVTNTIFQDYLKLSYVLDPTLQGRISLYLEGEFTKDELLQQIIKAYAANNVAVIPRKGMYHIQPVQRGAAGALPIADSFVLRSGEVSDQPVIVIYRMRYVDAKQTVNTIRPFITAGRPVIAEAASNTIVFAEDAANAHSVVSILRALDMNILKEVGMEIVPLRAISAEDAAASMEMLMNKLDIFKQGVSRGALAVLPLQRFGGVLVLAQEPEMLKAAREWLQALDTQGQESGEQIHIYFVENGLAADIADILSQMYGAGPGEASGRRTGQRIVRSLQQDRTGLGQGGRTTTTGVTPGTGLGQGQNRTTTGTQPGQTAQRGPTISTTISGNVIIVPDESNNAIVVRANANDYARIKKSIQALDIVPRAVLIQVLIAEVTLTDDFAYGVQWFLKNKGMDIGGKDGRYSTVLNNGTQFNQDFNLGTATSQGLSLFWGSVSGDIAALINLLSSATYVHVLSNPTLLATDNKEASITVGGREPIITQQQQSINATANSNIINSIQYEDTGIILSVIPHINSGGLVRMEVDQTIRDAVRNTTSGIDSPAFTERKVRTTLLAQNGNTVVIGGIIRANDNKTKSGIPFLSKIPVISPFFGSTSDTITRTELIIAITPRVVSHAQDPTHREFYDRLRQLRQRIEKETTPL